MYAVCIIYFRGKYKKGNIDNFRDHTRGVCDPCRVHGRRRNRYYPNDIRSERKNARESDPRRLLFHYFLYVCKPSIISEAAS